MKKFTFLIWLFFLIIAFINCDDKNDTTTTEIFSINQNGNEDNSTLAIDLIPPRVESAIIRDENPDRVEIIFSEKVRVRNSEHFIVIINSSTEASISKIFGDNTNSLKLKLRNEIEAEDQVQISYSNSNCAISDMANNCLENFIENLNVANSIDPYHLVNLAKKALVDQSLITISFFEKDFTTTTANVTVRAQKIVNDALGENLVEAQTIYSSNEEVINPETGLVDFSKNVASPLTPIETEFRLVLIEDSEINTTTGKMEVGVIGDLDNDFFSTVARYKYIPILFFDEEEDKSLEVKLAEDISGKATVELLNTDDHECIDPDGSINYLRDETKYGKVTLKFTDFFSPHNFVEFDAGVMVFAQDVSFLGAFLDMEYLRSYNAKTVPLTIATYSEVTTADCITDIGTYQTAATTTHTNANAIDVGTVQEDIDAKNSYLGKIETASTTINACLSIAETAYDDGGDDVQAMATSVRNEIYDNIERAHDDAAKARAYAYKAEAAKYKAQAYLYAAEAYYQATRAIGTDQANEVLADAETAWDEASSLEDPSSTQTENLMDSLADSIINKAYDQDGGPSAMDDEMKTLADYLTDMKGFSKNAKKARNDAEEKLDD